jgi:hypothetical protein
MQKETKVAVFMFVVMAVLLRSAWLHSWAGVLLGVLMFLAMLTYAAPDDTRRHVTSYNTPEEIKRILEAKRKRKQ